MAFTHRHAYQRIARSFMLCCLLVAVPMYGLSATIVQLLGTSHFHRVVAVVADPMAGWQDFRRTDHGGGAQLHGHGHGHSHSAFQRHHHAADDDSVVSLDGAGAGEALPGDGPATAGSACQTLAPAASPVVVPVPEPVACDWLPLAAMTVATRALARLDRPPKG